MALICPTCKGAVNEDDAYCATCGQSLVGPRAPNLMLREMPIAPSNQLEAPEQLAALESPDTPSEPLTLGSFADLIPPPVAQERVAMLESWLCPQCKTENRTADEYCESCGALKVKTGLPEIEQATLSETLLYPQPTVKMLEGSGVRLGWRLHSAGNTNEGIARRGNADEDSIFMLETRRMYEAHPESFGFYMVADGMGGQAAGEVASKSAIQTVSSIVISELLFPWLDGQAVSKEKISEVLHRSMIEAHLRIRQYNATHNYDSGTTATLCCVVDNLVVVANVGDSRTYLWRLKPETTADAPTQRLSPISASAKTQKLAKPGSASSTPASELMRLARVSRDQSLVEDLVQQGLLTRDEVYTDPRRNVVLHALGSPEEIIVVDTYDRTLYTGDKLLLCSDGLWEMVRDPAIEKILGNEKDLPQTVEHLIQTACQNGGQDNVSVIIVEAIYS
ncbi:protein phosphatase 2C domain-containing protein [Candidatus Chlorohelix sp.]|uniref:protein phosphatase 2C domain-containing protein n=1 Tax=Candidatus Chlorohelix sp. TaxID=3139201 RepID=UPI00305EB1B3